MLFYELPLLHTTREACAMGAKPSGSVQTPRVDFAEQRSPPCAALQLPFAQRYAVSGTAYRCGGGFSPLDPSPFPSRSCAFSNVPAL